MKKNKVVQPEEQEQIEYEEALSKSGLGMNVENKHLLAKKILVGTLTAGLVFGGIVLVSKFHVKPEKIVEVVSEELGE